MPRSFSSPGAAATSALFDFLREREARRRQDFLDEVTRSTATRQDDSPANREQMEGLREQRVAARQT